MNKIFRDTISVLTSKEKKSFFLLTLLSLFVSIADIAAIAFLFFVVNFYTPQHVMNLPLLSQWGIGANSLLPALLLFFIFLFKSVGAYYVYKMQFRFVYHVASRISGKNLLLYLEGSYPNHVDTSSAALVRKIFHQPIEFAHYVLAGIQQIITEAILVILSISILLIIDAKLLIILSIVLLPAAIILRYITKRRLSSLKKNVKHYSENALQYLHDAISGFIESNIYNKNEFFKTRYTNFQSVLNTYIADLQITQTVPSRFFELFAVLGLVVLIIVGEFTGIAKIADLFTLSAFTAAAYKIIPGISKMINLNSQVKTYEYTIEELVKEPHGAILKRHETDEKISSIEFMNVCFDYKNETVLSNINFKISTGTFIGISGDSGRGKTTMMNLLLGFLNPLKGEILFNGKEMNEEDRRLFWNKIAYVKQEPFIVNDSLLNNITLFEKNCDREKLNCIMETAGIKNFIDQDTEGGNRIIKEHGKNISGGQRQRIAVARALYKDADLIILDEPFNELDEQSEKSMLHHFKRLAQKGKIIILITHNTTSLSFCDSVIRLSE